MKPTLGRIVHVTLNGKTHAAIIAGVHTDELVALAVFDPDGSAAGGFTLPYDEGRGDRTWCWPPRTEVVPGPAADKTADMKAKH